MSSSAKLFLALKKKGGAEIPGESHAEGYAGQIEIEDWNWKISRSSDSDKTGAADKAEPSVLSFSKFMDRASTSMMSAARNGDELQAVFTLDDQTQNEFKLVLTLDSVRVIKYQMSIKLDKDMATIEEDWDFNYSNIEFKFYPQAEKGKPAGAISTDKLHRSPGASTASAEGPDAKLIDLAGQLSSEDLKKLIPKLEAAAKAFDEKAKSAPPPSKDGGKSGVGANR